MAFPLDRRTALKQLGLTGAGLALAGNCTQLGGAPDAGASHRPFQPAFQLGVATVSLKALPLDNALAAVQRVGLDRLSLHRAHSPWENTPAAWREVARRIKQAGLTVGCCGVLYLKNDEPALRRMLDYVRALDVRVFSCSPEPAALPLLERLVREYDLHVAIHNHGPEDKTWPSPDEVWRAVQPLDRRVGHCLDVGHSYRAGVDPAAAIRRYRERLYDVHLKDSAAAAGAEDVPVEIGRGRLDQTAILRALAETGYAGNVWFEYEKDPNDPVAGLAESVGFVRGLMRGLAEPG
jgi:sugar phosphate isomerase/epimerase